jgi:hypothetical protein
MIHARLLGWAVLFAAAGPGWAEEQAEGPLLHAALEEACEERTVLVPQWVMEERIETETRWRKEERKRLCTTYRTVPVMKEVPCPFTVWIREKRVDVQTVEISTPVYRWVDKPCTKWVPKKETLYQIHTRHECIPVTEKRIKKVDEGSYVEIEIEKCDEHGHKTKSLEQVWRPKIVEKEYEVTVEKTVCVEEKIPCEFDTVVPVESTKKVRVLETAKREKKIEHPYYTLVPKQKWRMELVCSHIQIPETKEVIDIVDAPYTVEKKVLVPVCKMVPKTIRTPAAEAPGGEK